MKKKDILKTILIFGTAFMLSVIIFQNNAKKINKNELLIKEVAKRLYEKEKETRKSLYKIEQNILQIEQNDSMTIQKIHKTEQNYKNIIKTIKQLDYEKAKTDNEILNYSDSSNWVWFNNRFPKYNNRTPIETN